MSPIYYALGSADDIFESHFYVIVEMLGLFWVFFGSILKVFGRFLGFENIVGGAQSVVNGTQKKRGRGVFTKRPRLRPIELRIFVVGGLFGRTAMPTLPGPTERIWKTRKFRFFGSFF